MRDQYGREINYLRLSITDRCNLRCRYCMPAQGVELVDHCQLLRYDELLRVAQAAVSLGIRRFKITGGEPLARRDCPAFIRQLKALPGVEQVTLTTNGLLLPPVLEELLDGGLDGVNLSLDTLDDAQYRSITRSGYSVKPVLEALCLCAGRLPTKINAVLLEETADQLIPLARLAEALPVDVRFIEQMPIGQDTPPAAADSPLERLRRVWPRLRETDERRGNGPARYYSAPELTGRLGLIEAVSHSFCQNCNRVRLTSTGVLKPCLCYGEGRELATLLRGGGNGEALRQAMEETIFQKPPAHCFGQADKVTEHRTMRQIGG